MKTEKKKCGTGTLRIGLMIFMNQFGDIGNSLNDNSTKNRPSRF